MNVTPAMIRPMAIVTNISSSVNPRFPLDFIVSFARAPVPVRDENTAAHCASRADSRTDSPFLIASLIFLGGGDNVKVLQVNTPGHTTFVIRRWLLKSRTDDVPISGREAAPEPSG